MVACSMTVARGWSRVVGESRGVDKDRELTALGNAEVRSEGAARTAPGLPRLGESSGVSGSA